ncbi:hypothetical protein BASA61_003890 [Batrachochytrium salamandrivorans]|nr:hypothetical protein BASA62_002557 [Batrachochytrium salamandrivorans]KAH6595042.1 hypothetical protein BASA61_003890 [Batrachochytrium salamandrivorans]
MKKLGAGISGSAYLGTKGSMRYQGLEVVYKIIPISSVFTYALEQTPPHVCHNPDPIVRQDQQLGDRCMAPRPESVWVPYEVKVLEYLSQPKLNNQYVPTVVDYIVAKEYFVLVMKYLGSDWMTLDNYMEKYGRMSVSDARIVFRELVIAILSLRKLGVIHGDIHGGNMLYNPKIGKLKLLDFGRAEPISGWKEERSAYTAYRGSLRMSTRNKATPDRVERNEMDPSFDQSRAHGTRYLMLACMDALWTARKAIQIGILVDTHPFSVDHCILCDLQLLSTSIAHLVVECEQVTGHRIQSGLVPAIQKSRLRLLGRALDPGVENVYTWLRGGVLNGEADLDQLLVGRDCGA